MEVGEKTNWHRGTVYSTQVDTQGSRRENKLTKRLKKGYQYAKWGLNNFTFRIIKIKNYAKIDKEGLK